MAEAPNGAATAQATAPGGRVDPYRAYNFKLVIGDRTDASFTACSGVDISVAKIEYRAGGSAPTVVQLPGLVEFGDITLKWGITPSHELWDWFMKTVEGKVERRNVSIVMLDPDGVREVLRWNLLGAWPRAYRGMPLDALHREIAIETLTLSFESITRV